VSRGLDAVRVMEKKKGGGSNRGYSHSGNCRIKGGEGS